MADDSRKLTPDQQVILDEEDAWLCEAEAATEAEARRLRTVLPYTPAVLERLSKLSPNLFPLTHKIRPKALAVPSDGSEDSTEYLMVRTSEAAKRFDVTAKTICQWCHAEKAPKRIRPGDCRGYVLIHSKDWKI